MNIKTIGRGPDCDLIIDQLGVADLQARLELCEDGSVYLLDADSGVHTHLKRNEQWIRIHKVRLCIADRIRFGEHEIPLSALVSIFGKRSDIRLGGDHFSLRRPKAVHSKQRNSTAGDTQTQRPRRNPLTGKIEQEL